MTQIYPILGALDWFPDEAPQIGSQTGIPKIGFQMGYSRLNPKWGTPDWITDRLPGISSYMGGPLLAPKWGVPDRITDSALQIGFKMGMPQI